jgi:hypothetical protein
MWLVFNNFIGGLKEEFSLSIIGFSSHVVMPDN